MGAGSKASIIGDFIGQIKRANEIGLTGNKPHIWLSCSICNQSRWVNYFRRNIYLKCFHCAVKACYHPSREAHHRWKGGRMNMYGYIRIKIYPDNPYYPMAYQKNGLILEHRLIMAQHLGRLLKSKEFVHHKNGKRDDNRIENLELKLDGQHMKEHSLGYRDGYHQGYKAGYEKGKREAQSQISVF